MNKNSRNEGIIQSGGNITANNMAVGRNARIIDQNILKDTFNSLEEKGLIEMKQKLNELVEAINAHSNSLANLGEVMESTEKLAKELSKDKPNKFSITEILSGIAKMVEPVADIVSAIKAITALL